MLTTEAKSETPRMIREPNGFIQRAVYCIVRNDRLLAKFCLAGKPRVSMSSAINANYCWRNSVGVYFQLTEFTLLLQ